MYSICIQLLICLFIETVHKDILKIFTIENQICTLQPSRFILQKYPEIHSGLISYGIRHIW